MKITLKDETQTLIISDEELNNPNFVDLEFLDEEAIDKDNPRGYITEITVPLEDLKCATDAFWQKKMNNEK